MPDVDYYAVLGIERDASAEVVKAAYRRAVKAAHPDHGGTEGLFVLVQEAGDHLLDPGTRAAYDRGDRGPGTGLATVPADPWAQNWSDAVSHSPDRPPAFAKPWWSTPPSPTPARKRSQRSLFDHGFGASHAPFPFGILVARLGFLAFVLGFLVLRVLAATPRDPALIDRLGLVWTFIPLIGAVGGAWAIRAIRHDPARYGGLRTAWTWCVIDLVATIAVIVAGTAALHNAV